MTDDKAILTALLSEVSQLSAPFQNLHDYAPKVMNDPETDRLFTERLGDNPPMHEQIKILKASLSAPGPLSEPMREVLAAAEGHLHDIIDLVAIEPVYKLRDLAADR